MSKAVETKYSSACAVVVACITMMFCLFHIAPGQTENMTDTEKRDCYSARQKENGERTWVDDAFDESYKEKEGVSSPLKIVWRNVVLMTLLHIGAVYGLTLIPSAKASTLLWGGFALLLILCSNILTFNVLYNNII